MRLHIHLFKLMYDRDDVAVGQFIFRKRIWTCRCGETKTKMEMTSIAHS